MRNIEPEKEKPRTQHNKVLLTNNRALMNTLILSHIRCIDIGKIESIQNLLESIDETLKSKRQKPYNLLFLI